MDCFHLYTFNPTDVQQARGDPFSELDASLLDSPAAQQPYPALPPLPATAWMLPCGPTAAVELEVAMPLWTTQLAAPFAAQPLYPLSYSAQQMPTSVMDIPNYSAIPHTSLHQRRDSFASSISSTSSETSSHSSHSRGAAQHAHSIRRARANTGPYAPYYAGHGSYLGALEVDDNRSVAEALGMAVGSVGSVAGSRRSSDSSGSWSEREVEHTQEELDLPVEGWAESAGGSAASGAGQSDEEGTEFDVQSSLVMQELDDAAIAVRDAVTTATQDRARGAYVQAWLAASYVLDEDGTVSRQEIYGSYVEASEARGIRVINAASFGKALRQKWPQIKIRRLGTRATSRYHHCGIRPATVEEAKRVQELDLQGHTSISGRPLVDEPPALDAAFSLPLPSTPLAAPPHLGGRPVLPSTDQPNVYSAYPSLSFTHPSQSSTFPFHASSPAVNHEGWDEGEGSYVAWDAPRARQHGGKDLEGWAT